MKHLALILMLLIITCCAVAQNTWTPMNGPCYANDPRDLTVANDGTMYTPGGASREIMKSTNQGDTWTHLTSPKADVYCVAVKPNNSSWILVGLGDATVWQTSDGGSTWANVILAGTLAARANRITFSPNNPDSVFLGIAEVPDNSIYSLYLSKNAGVNWNVANFPTATSKYQTTITDIVFDPTNAKVIYITGASIGTSTTLEEGVWKTTNGGTSWTAKNSGIGSNIDIAGLAIDPSNSNILYSCTYSGTWKIYKSTNGGTWVATQPAVPQPPFGRDLLCTSSNTILIATTLGIWRSTDAGVNWGAVATVGLYDQSCQVLNAYSSNIFCGSATSVYRSTNSGVNWVDKNSGFIRLPLVAVAKLGNTIFAAAAPGFTSNLVHKSTDAGASWSCVLDNVIPTTTTIFEATDIAFNSSVVVLSGRKPTNGGPVIRKSTDQGTIWDYYAPAVTGAANQIALNPTTINIAGQYGSVAVDFNSSLSGGVWTAWTQIGIGSGSGEAKAMIADPTSASILYAGGTLGVYKSTDAGQSWYPRNGTSPNILPVGITVNALAIDANSTQTLFAGLNANGTTPSCLWKTTDGGSTSWTNVTGYLTQTTTINSLFLHPVNSSCGYICGIDGSTPFLYKSAIMGTSFNLPEQSGLPTVYKVLIDTNDYYTLYFASSNGLYKKTHQWDGNLGRSFTFSTTADIQLGSLLAGGSLTSGLVVPAGITLTISSPSTVKFLKDANLTAYGTLTAIGTSGYIIWFSPLNSNETFKGVAISTTGTPSTIQYCDFDKMSTSGVSVTTTAASITNCTFREFNAYGLAFSTVAGTPTILARKNRITSTPGVGWYGAWFINSDVGMDSTYISGCRYGVYITGGAPGLRIDTIEYSTINGVSIVNGGSAKFGGYVTNEAGNNIIHNSNVVEVSADASTPFFGNATSGGHNKIYDDGSGVRVSATNSSVVTAQYTEWGGTGSPPASFFSKDGSSSVDYSNPILVSPPTLVSPLNNDVISCTGTPASGTMKWNAISGATSYRVQVARDIGFTNELHDVSGVTGTQWTFTDLTCGVTYYWHVNATDGVGTSDWSTRWSFSTCMGNCARTVHGDGNETSPVDQIPRVYRLGQNYPNPFNPTTNIAYDLPENTHVVLRLFDVLGQEVKLLMDEDQSAGFKSVPFDASNLPSGMYFYRLNAGTFSDIKKMMLVK